MMLISLFRFILRPRTLLQLEGNEDTITKKADVFSFGKIAEYLGGEPFDEGTSSRAITAEQRQAPMYNNEINRLIESCCNPNADEV